MKHFYSILILNFLFFASLKGQDYHLFSLENETIFELKNSTDISCNSNDCYFSPVVKDVSIIGNYSVFTFEKTYKKIVQNTNSTCSTFADTSFWGQELRITDNFTFEFLNIDGETITIQPQRYLNESWEAYRFPNNSGNYIEAKVTNLFQNIVHSDLDSLKTISFFCKDSLGNTISHLVNQMKLEVSKHYGMLRSLNFLNFPNDTSFLLLASHNHLSSGVKNLKWKEIYDFEVGDEFHIHEYITGIPYQSDGYEKRIVLSKSNTSSSWIYIVDREYYFENDQGDTLHTRDTITEIYPFFYYSDTILPRELFNFDNFGNGSAVHWNVDYSQYYLQKKKIHKASFYDQVLIGDTCAVFLLGSSVPDTFYLENLGGGYYHAAGSGSYNNRILEYYKKTDCVWGNPINFGLFNHLKTINTAFFKLKTFPNPSSDLIYINIPVNLQKSKLTVFDVMGRVVINKKLRDIQQSEIFTLDIQGLTSGMYNIRIQSKDKIWQSKIVKQ